ncbi:NADPH-dependent FMN reductase [Fulvivirga imtechensis AK7]|uniref:NADPH-dependent FMN reductase n=1 Tax=Fulvivirga imtechensis AK7 TaxID=1237149 RepID=L8JPT8_9BACT|nr:NAD(P)H-dependent oxidoreductase [Fulvivirga imtechensis]ELR70213.1 NADPH-dependent FMN reductase [Fulvivirga imtechensis AK7]
MKKILAFSGSNSPNSINQQLVAYASGLLNETPSVLINLRDFPMEVFGLEIMETSGIPKSAAKLYQLIREHDAFIIAVSENNHSVSAAFKNAMDWISRAGTSYNVFENKPVLLLGTSPGQGGAAFAIRHATDIITLLKGKIVNSLPVPGFHKTVELREQGLHFNDQELHDRLHNLVENFESQLQEEAGISK